MESYPIVFQRIEDFFATPSPCNVCLKQFTLRSFEETIVNSEVLYFELMVKVLDRVI